MHDSKGLVATRTNGQTARRTAAGTAMRIDPYFCPAGVDPFDTVEWDLRTAQIKDENGKVLFEQTNCEIPKDWSALATNVVVSKYFYGEHGTPERETSVRQVIYRVARTIADWGTQDGYFATPEDGENYYRELAWLCLHQHGAFNSPVWFNVGLYHQYGVKGCRGNYYFNVETKNVERPETPYEYPQASACFIQSVEDNMESIMRLAASEAMLFKFGSGTGTDVSSIRSSREKLSGGGTPSGPLSFMRVYDQIAAVVKCVTADTYICTGDGIRRIGDVVGDAPEGFSPAEQLDVATPEGRRAASQVFVGRESPVRRMLLRWTGLELTGTHEHPVLVLTPEFRLVWKPLRDVAEGDRVAVDRSHPVWSRNIPDLTQYHILPGSGRGEAAKQTFTLPDRMTPELARLLGYLAAEGCVDQERIRFSNADLDVFEDFVQCFERSFGARIAHGISSRTNPQTGVITHQFSASWHYVARFLVNLGAGGKSADKQVPQAILDSPQQFVSEFLRGYFEGDGHVGRNIYACTKSAELARQLQVVLLNYGIVSQRRDSVVQGRRYWRILLCGRNAEQFIDQIGFVSERKRKVRPAPSRGTNYDVVPHLVDHLRSRFHGRGYYHDADGELQRTDFDGLFSRSGDITYDNLQERFESVQTGLAELDPEAVETLVYIVDKRFLWDEVREIAEAGTAVTYDLTVPGVHAFSSNGIVSHNSGGKTRRAAKMQSIKDWHPDVLEFIQCKAKEEKKARVLIESGEYEANFNGEAYSSIMFQNANLSVRVSDEFMQAVVKDGEWHTHWVTDAKREGPAYKARDVMRQIAEGTWYCGDPGLQYETTINNWHTCKKTGPINASNPCSEYMFLDDTACNLASINLKKCLRDDGSFDVERFRRACAIYITAQEILVDHASYPTPTIAENSHLFRPLGLGYANLGSLLMTMGIPYDSDAGRGICGALTALLNGQGYLTSSEIAADIGPFAGYRENEQSMLDVMQMHRDAVEKINPACPRYLKDAARQVWNECLQSGRKHGYRNAQATVLAPTGTIAFMMDCDTTGIEPDIALIKYKQLAGGGMLRIVNRTVPVALKALGYDQPEIEGILAYIESQETIEGAPGLKPEHLPVFDCAFKAAKGTRSIAWTAHVGMMAAAQPFLSGAISKTVNMPADSTVEDIEQAYMEGWKLGLKALAIYRDGSKQSQPLATSKEGDRKKKGEAAAAPAPSGPVRRRLPETRQSVTHKFAVGTHEGYITVGLFEDGAPGELFITMAKEGSTVGGLMDVIGTLTSLALQYGVPLKALVDKFSHMRFEPSGWTKNADIPMAKSVPDYIFRWLGMQFIPGFREANAPKREGGTENGGGGGGGAGKQETAEPGASPAAAVQAVQDVLAAHKVPSSALQSIYHENGSRKAGPMKLEDSGVFVMPLTSDDDSPAVRSQQFSTFQSDAPACDNCGAITVRNGNCYLCHNCGNSMGCS